MQQKNNPTSLQEKMRLAAERTRQIKEKEQEEEAAYYQKISSGTNWKIFKIFTYYCLGLALLITIETIFDGNRTHLSSSEYVFHSGSVQQGDDWYFPKYTELTGFLDTSFYVVNSPIFGAPKYLVWTSGYKDTKTPLTYTEYDVWRFNSIYSYYVYIQITLLIPLLVLWYKRPTAMFKFGRMLCLFLIFPASIYLLFVTFGITDLLPLNR